MCWFTSHEPTGRLRTFEVQLNEAPGLAHIAKNTSIKIGAREEGSLKVPLHITNKAKPGVHVLTANIRSKNLAVDHWAEALIRIPGDE